MQVGAVWWVTDDRYSKLLGMDASLMDLDIREEIDKLQQTLNTEEGTTLST